MRNNYSNGVLGNSVDINIDGGDNSTEIRADIKVYEFNSKRIWGQVLNCNGEPVPNSLVKLVRKIIQGNKKYYEGIAHTITDSEGFYQFDVCESLDNECYKIIINKAVTGPEKVIKSNNGTCNVCGVNNSKYNHNCSGNDGRVFGEPLNVYGNDNSNGHMNYTPYTR